MAARAVRRLAETVSEKVVDDIYRCSFMKQTGVSLKYMMDFGSYPSEKNLLHSSHFLHKELPVRLAHRVTELENLPYGLSTKAPVLKVCMTILSVSHSPSLDILQSNFHDPWGFLIDATLFLRVTNFLVVGLFLEF
jgi:hypothetical protein